MPNRENLLLRDKGDASVFCPLKSSEMIPAETMPCRETRTYSIRPVGNTTSNVNDWMKVKANMGITAVAGVVAGAKRSRLGD